MFQNRPEIITIRQTPPPVESSFWQNKNSEIQKNKIDQNSKNNKMEKVEIIHIHQFPKLELAKLINLIFKVSFFGSVVITPFIYKEVAIAIIVLFIIYISLFVEIKSESKNKSKTIDHKIENIKILEPNPPASQSFPQGATPPQDPQKKATLTEILEKAKSSGNEKLAKRILNFQNVFNSFQGQIDFDKVDLK